jgi:hypothetical protein
MTILLKKKESLINGFFWLIIILPMLNYFQLLYDYFSLIKNFHPTLFTAIYGYFQLLLVFFVISP